MASVGATWAISSFTSSTALLETGELVGAVYLLDLIAKMNRLLVEAVLDVFELGIRLRVRHRRGDGRREFAQKLGHLLGELVGQSAGDGDFPEDLIAEWRAARESRS